MGSVPSEIEGEFLLPTAKVKALLADWFSQGREPENVQWELT